jgi:uncharacterized membrane protein
VRSPRRLAAITIPASAGTYLTSAHPQLALLLYTFLVLAGIAAAALLLPAIWSRKAYRRDAAYGLVKLIIESRKNET